MFKVGDEVVLPLIIEKSCSEEIVGAKSEDGVVHIYKIEEAKRLLKPRESKTYESGLSDAWELAKKIYDMKCDAIEEIFGVKGGFYEVIRNFTFEDCRDRIEAYEREKEIKVGDVVTNGKYICVVTNKIDENNSVILYGDGCFGKIENKFLEKTGKHIDIEGLLRQIGE